MKNRPARLPRHRDEATRMAEYGIILLVVLLGTLSSLTVSSGSLADAIIHLVGRFLGT